MPGKYPPNTYGAYLEQLAETIHRNVQEIGEMYQDPNWQAEYAKSEKVQNIWEKPPAVQDWERARSYAGRNLCAMRLVQKMMNDKGLGLDDPTPPISRHDDWKYTLSIEAEKEYSKNRTTQDLFQPVFFDGAKKFLHLDGKNPPAPEEVLLPYNEMMGERQTTIETAKAAKAAAKTAAKTAAENRKEPAKALLDDLKRSEQRSFYGKFKSFFVGNSKEYETALKAVEGISTGTGDPKQAKQAIEQYLDLRGNKVRDHQFGRNRFDAMMKSLALVSTPAEFMEFCEKTEQARFDRAKGGYKDAIDVSRYLSPEQIARGKEEMKQRDAERLEADKGVHAMAYGDFVNDLNKLKNEKGFDTKLRQELKNFMVEHPMVRGAARDFVEKNGLNFRVPEPAEGMSRDVAEKAKQVDATLRAQLGVPQKVQQRRSQGPEL